MARFLPTLWAKKQSGRHDEILAAKLQSQMKGHWLPDRKTLKGWLVETVETADLDQNDTILDPSLVAFKELVESDSLLRMLSREMLREVPDFPPYNQDPVGHSEIRDFDHLLHLINRIITQGPQFYHVQEIPTSMGMIGTPINAILDWPMNTKSGYTFFLDTAVNERLNAVLQTWGRFLRSPESQKCLTAPDGWLSRDALEMLTTVANNGETSYSFSDIYVCDPDKPNFGFSSWDDFFTREFRPERRPVDAPDDAPPPSVGSPLPTAVIANSCESVTFRFSRNCKMTDTFWSKSQPYSLSHMLDHSTLAWRFAGGTVYQAFLSAMVYHRWHSPVSGTVVDVRNVPGTYYSTNYWQGFANDEDGPDASAANMSQPYLSAVAARGIIFIQADNVDIGLMAAVYIGMAEVSSCEFTVRPGDRLRKGQQIGMFHFGGSSHCLIFRPETKIMLSDSKNPSGNRAVNSALAVATSAVADEHDFVVV